MKKLLLFAVSAAFAGMVNAQDCTPQIDNAAPLVGLNPNPPAGSVNTVPYDEVNTLVIPKSVDNTLTPAPGDSIVLCEIEVLNVIGMPPGYTYDVWAFRAGAGSQYDVLAQTVDTIHIFQNTFTTKVCIRLKNPTPPASSDMTDGLMDRDTAYIQIAVAAWADLGFGCTSLQAAGGTDTFTVRLAIKDAVYAGIEDEFDNTTFNVRANHPNPANDLTYINFSTPTAGDVTISLFDAVGRNIRNAKVGSSPGVNTYQINTSDLRSGVYMYSVTYGGKTISKKMIVNR
jgi:hypothetical protein